MKTEIKLERLTEVITEIKKKKGTEDETQWGLIEDMESNEDNPYSEQIDNYLGEETIGYSNHIIWENEKLIIIPMEGKTLEETIQRLQDLSNLIFWAYDDYKEEQEDEATETWDDFGLGGDDDSDYNSSYLDIILELITATLELDIKQNRMRDNDEIRKETKNLFLSEEIH